MRILLRILFILVILQVPFSAGAQYSSVRKTLIRSSEVNALVDSALSSIPSNPSKAFDYVEKALSLTIKNNDRSGEALCYQALGKINLSLEQPDLALNYLNRALILFKSSKEIKHEHTTYTLIADAYSIQNNNSEALDYYNKSLKYHEKQKNITEVLKIKSRIADLHYKSGNLLQAANMYKEIKEQEVKIGDTNKALEAQNKLGNTYIESNENDKALQTFKEAEKIAESSNNAPHLSNSLQQQSSIYRKKKQYNQELNTRKKLLDIESKLNNNSAVAEQNLEIGNNYLIQNKTDEAIPYINRSIEISDKTGNLEQKSIALQSLSAVYSKNEQYTKALDVYKKYVETVDAIYKKKEAETEASMELIAKLNRKIQRIDLIEKELNISDKTVELLKQSQQLNIKELRVRKLFNISLIGAFLIAVTALIFIYRSSMQKRKANQMLALKSLRSQMNPHFIYNSLNSVNNYISKNDERAANRYLSDFSLLMRSVMENSKHDFVPLSSEIDVINRYLALEHTRFSDKFDYKFEVDETLETENILVPPMLIQPFIENAIWHGLRYLENKGFLKVIFSKSKDKLSITIEDNGIGRKKSEDLKTRHQKEHNSTGLKNTSNRVDIINDLYKTKIAVKVEDADKENSTGTRVFMTIPLNIKLT